MNAVKEIGLKKHLAVRRAAESLDYDSWWLLAQAQTTEVPHPALRTMGQVLSNSARVTAIGRLLELGAIQATYPEITKEVLSNLDQMPPGRPMMKYKSTEFGRAIFNETQARMKFAEHQEQLKKMFDKPETETNPDQN